MREISQKGWAGYEWRLHIIYIRLISDRKWWIRLKLPEDRMVVPRTHAFMCLYKKARISQKCWARYEWKVVRSIRIQMHTEINKKAIYIYTYKVSLRDEASGVAQERNEKHPAWNEYHYAGNRRIKIVFGYLVRTNTLINRRTLHFWTGRYFLFAYTWRQTLWSYVILGILCNIISS